MGVISERGHLTLPRAPLLTATCRPVDAEPPQEAAGRDPAPAFTRWPGPGHVAGVLTSALPGETPGETPRAALPDQGARR